MIEELFDKKCIQISECFFKTDDYYRYCFDMRKLISNPGLLKQMGDQMYETLNEFDVICAVSYSGISIASYISTTYNKPMIYMKEKQKKYFPTVEGEYKAEQRCVIIDDVLLHGTRIQEAINYLHDKINVIDCIVVFDHQKTSPCTMPVKYVVNKTDVVKYRLKEIKDRKQSQLCFSADLSDYPRLWSIIEQIGKRMVICKIHFDTVDHLYKETFKYKMIEYSLKYDFLIMEDRKFNDISYIVKKQFRPFENWIDMVTVHTLVTPDVIKILPGVLLVANMSNNTYDFSKQAIELAVSNKSNVVGFISQNRLHPDFCCMTPGIGINHKKIDDQKYRSLSEIDTDIKIIGRAIYQSENLESDMAAIEGIYYS